jgi:SAM-dependent methyltransferase
MIQLSSKERQIYMNSYHEQNRASWNRATPQHHSHKPDLLERFRRGESSIYPEEIELLGDVKDKKVAHLQCNDGQDTVSIARDLEADITGIDIADYAIDFAGKLARAAGVSERARFVRADIFDWLRETPERFHAVFTSYGAICWISDLGEWARGIARVLQPEGRFVMVEFHPFITVFDPEWNFAGDYMGGTGINYEGVGDYVGNDYAGSFENPEPSFEFPWGLGEITRSLIDAGLTLNHIKEYPYSNGYQCFPNMRPGPGNRYYPPEGKPVLPLMFSLRARK